MNFFKERKLTAFHTKSIVDRDHGVSTKYYFDTSNLSLKFILPALLIFVFRNPFSLTFNHVLTLYYLKAKKHINAVLKDKCVEYEFENNYFIIKSLYLGERSDGLQPHTMNFSRGFSKSIDGAMAKCIGECLERTPTLYYRNHDLLEGSYETLGKQYQNIVNPRELNVFSDLQRKQFRITDSDYESQIFRWVSVDKSITNTKTEKVLLPAQHIFWGYNYRLNNTEEIVLRENGTHGSAAYYTEEGAKLRALLECIGRDGFFYHWLHTKTPKQLDVTTIDNKKCLDYIYKSQELGFKVHFLITPSPNIPVYSICCVLEEKSEKRQKIQFAAGHAAGLDLYESIHSALEESWSMYHWLTQFLELEDYERYCDNDFDGMKSYGDVQRLRYWSRSENAANIEFFIKGEKIGVDELVKTMPTQTVTMNEEEMLKFVLTTTMSKSNVYFYKFTDELLTKLNFYSIKAIVPNLIPMFHNMRHVPVLKSEEVALNKLNKLPHIFP